MIGAATWIVRSLAVTMPALRASSRAQGMKSADLYRLAQTSTDRLAAPAISNGQSRGSLGMAK